MFREYYYDTDLKEERYRSGSCICTIRPEVFGTPTENIKVRIEYLYHDKMKEHPFTDSDQYERTDTIKESIATMKGYLLDADRNQPLKKIYSAYGQIRRPAGFAITIT